MKTATEWIHILESEQTTRPTRLMATEQVIDFIRRVQLDAAAGTPGPILRAGATPRLHLRAGVVHADGRVVDLEAVVDAPVMRQSTARGLVIDEFVREVRAYLDKALP